MRLLLDTHIIFSVAVGACHQARLGPHLHGGLVSPMDHVTKDGFKSRWPVEIDWLNPEPAT
jgi:hypothetical protein